MGSMGIDRDTDRPPVSEGEEEAGPPRRRVRTTAATSRDLRYVGPHIF